MPTEPSDVVSDFPKHEATQRQSKAALCLSGGGYRSMLFHVGALKRLNEEGYLPLIDRYSSVSGGSIAAGVLAAKWTDLDFDDGGVARNFAVFEQAVFDFTRAIEIRPDEWAYTLRAAAYSYLGQAELAQADYDRVAEIAPRIEVTWDE